MQAGMLSLVSRCKTQIKSKKRHGSSTIVGECVGW
jgi:hypothetical protein